jgi:hypothetical protein
MTRVLKWVLAAVVALGVVLIVVVNFSERKQFYVCDGETRVGDKSTPDKAYVELSEYRWWVHLWSESDGNLRVQLDKANMIDYLTTVMRIGDGRLALYQFMDFDRKFKGGLKAANGEISIKIGENVMFSGNCIPG